MLYFIIGGAVVGLFAGGFEGAIVGAISGAAFRQWIFRKFWM